MNIPKQFEPMSGRGYISPYVFGAGANIIPSYISKLTDLSSHAKVCYGVMGRCSNNRNYVFASVDYIMDEAGLPKRTVERALAELEEYGLIETVRRRNGTALRYFVNHVIFSGFLSPTKDIPPPESDAEGDNSILADREPPPVADREPPSTADREPPPVADRSLLSLKPLVKSLTSDKESSPLPPSSNELLAVDEDGYEDHPRPAPAQRSKWQRPGKPVKRKSLSARIRDGEIDGDPVDASAIPRANPRSAAALPPAAPETTRLPDIALRWNAAVKSGPAVRVWSPNRFEAAALRSAQADPAFAEMLDELLAKCEAFNAAGNPFALGKLLQEWSAVANGTYDWMLKGKDAKATKSFAQKASDDLFAGTLRRIDEMAARGEIKKS